MWLFGKEDKLEGTPNNKKKVQTSNRQDLGQKQNNATQEAPSNGYLKIYKSKVPNTNISLEKKVPVSEFIDYVRGADHKNLLSEMGYVYMWDFGVNATKHLKEGDKIWILTGDKLYETELKFIIKDEKGEIGDTIGWYRQFNAPWKNVAVFKSCVKHDRIPRWIQPYSKKQKSSIARNFYKIG